ncbi:MFS multidrug transporter [Pleurostoma richardsiae]|uniref:MFS multidrug transporter n=1 Tax=Pleurostoma richardsiae TaxID=41990 RepID=A0AA38RXH8_9PEZI|nr:MFS multidrug transporter [Pleurostoma richardsiae]
MADAMSNLTPVVTAAQQSNAQQSAGNNEDAEPEYMTGLPFYLVISSLVLSCLLVALGASMLGTATPSITTTFHSINDVGWYGSSYLVANCAMMPLTGKIFTLFELKWTFIAFIAVFEVGTLVAAVSVSSTMLIIGRSISGIGGSGIVNGAVTIITVIRPMAKRPFLIGLLMACVAAGQVAGPLIGGALSEVSWRWCFYINLPLGGFAVFFFLVFVKLPARSSFSDDKTLAQKLASIDFVGFAVFAAACVLVLMGLEWGGTTYAWDSSVIIGLICGGGVLFVIFFGWSMHLKEGALIPTRLFRDRINLACGITSVVQSGGVFILMFFLPIWFQGIQNASPVISGVKILPTIVSQVIASLLCGASVQKTGYYLPQAVIGNAFVAIASGLFTTFTPSTGAGSWIGFQILGGVGRGMIMQLLITAVQANAPPEDAPVVSSYIMFTQYFGGAVFICVGRTVLTSSLTSTIPKDAPSVDPQLVIDTGVTELSEVFHGDLLKQVLQAYNDSIVDVFYAQLALSAAAFVCSFFLGWRDVRGRKKPTDVETGSETEKRTEAGNSR